ncbi:hypothetical protein [uncultured Sulfitobacter sp.]|uniref:YeeE/YedE family protein n=1 Tax=uncultured Sulfitobacter sp. TaxID=191468 RepID=UPI003440709F
MWAYHGRERYFGADALAGQSHGYDVASMAFDPWVYFGNTGQLPTISVPSSRPLLIFGALRLGIGVTFGSGCTSGHGVCGMARISRRSLVATLVTMITTALTIYVMRHVWEA